MLRQRSAWDTVSRPMWIPRTQRNPACKHLEETPARVGLNFAGQGERQQGDHLLLKLGRRSRNCVGRLAKQTAGAISQVLLQKITLRGSYAL